MPAKANAKQNRIKNFILDTNVILYSPYCLETFEENNIIIPAIVLEELDSMKKSLDPSGYNAREFMRTLEGFRLDGDLIAGVRADSGALVRVALTNTVDMPADFVANKHDNMILSVAMHVKQESSADTILVTKDTNLRIKANVVGLPAEDYYHEKRYQSIEDTRSILDVSEDYINTLYQYNTLQVTDDILMDNEINPIVNEYFMLRARENAKKTALVRFGYEGDNPAFTVLPDIDSLFGITPANYKQRFLMNALLDPNINIVFAVGIAGTGKTLLSLVAALSQVLTKDYKRMVVTRSPIPMGRDLGFLPGTLAEKIDPWLKPIYDNIELIVENVQNDKAMLAREGIGGRRNITDISLDYLRDANLIEIEALTYIRGRTFNDTFIIIDEAQNLTPHEAKTIITRAGHNTKIVLTGDPYQIDNPYVDEKDNGLVNASEKFKMHHSTLAASIFLDKGERSPLASEAATIL